MHEDDDEEKKATVKEVDYHAHSKQTKKRLRHVQRQVSDTVGHGSLRSMVTCFLLCLCV